MSETITLTEKSLRILELPQVLELLKAKAGSEPAKEQIEALRPSVDPYEIKRRLDETSAAKKLIGIKGNLSFSGLKDVRPSVYRAERGGMLNTRELMDIGALLRAARTVQSYPMGDKPVNTEIDYLFTALHANKYFEDKIANSIMGEEEIADNASPELADIRRHIRNANEKVRQSLQKIISSPAYSKALQEPIITMRNGRYVVPVKADHRSSVPGLVHDISSSGATLFVEPMAAVQANNDIRELLAKEKNEIDRILMTMSAEAADFGEDIVMNVNVLTQLDVIFAKAKLSYDQDGGAPELSEDGSLYLRRARHPLLPKKTAVPIDVTLGGEFDTLVITGPNTGGKTVSLKTMGLLCLMAQCGLHIPAADGSRVPVFNKILADIGDEQSIEQSLSTFSSHMVNIVEILK
ncbi:MAG: endonuclease MutS2, partial [Oscillospiraceae bacterium]|nr:endonuclease MutS2 [Oscillospiraceae bacterium]